MNTTRTLAGALIVVLLAAGIALLAPRNDGVWAPDVAKDPQRTDSAPSLTERSSPESSSKRRADDGGRLFSCSIEDFAPTAPDDDGAATEDEYAALIDQLTASSDLERRLTGAVLKTAADYPDAIDDLVALIVDLPDHPLLHWHLLDACAVRSSHPLCSSGQAEARVIRYLGHNGEAWAKVAYHRLRRDDIEGGIEALRNASAAAEFGDYWHTEVEVVFRALEGQQNAEVPARLIQSIGHVAAFPARYLRLSNACAMAAADSPAWFDACIAYARRKEADADSLVGRSIGAGLQRAIYAAIGDDENTKAAEERSRDRVAVLSDSAMRDGEVLLAADESVGLEWIQRLSVYGRIAANEYLRAEVERLSASPRLRSLPATDVGHRALSLWLWGPHLLLRDGPAVAAPEASVDDFPIAVAPGDQPREIGIAPSVADHAVQAQRVPLYAELNKGR